MSHVVNDTDYSKLSSAPVLTHGFLQNKDIDVQKFHENGTVNGN